MPLKVLERHESKDGPKCLLSLVDEIFDNDPLVQVSPIKEKNSFVSEGTPLLVVESARRLFTLRSPIEGLIKGFNRELFSMVDQFDFSNWVVSLEEMTAEKYQEWKTKNIKPKEVPKRVDVGLFDMPAFINGDGIAGNVNIGLGDLRADQLEEVVRQHIRDGADHIRQVQNQPNFINYGLADAPRIVARPNPRQPARRNGPRPPNPYMRNG